MLKSPLVTIAIRWGFIGGALAIALLIGTYYLGKHPFMISPFLDFRVLLFGVMIYFTLREFRDAHQEGALYFWQGMIGSFVMVMVAGTVASLLFLVFMALEENFVAAYIPLMTEYLKSFSPEDIERIGKEVYERNLEQLASTNGKQLAGLYFAQGLIIGFFVSIIVSVIWRKQPKSN
jgi:uncharacterized membrane-anchored protein YitT (DUF2179 family)